MKAKAVAPASAAVNPAILDWTPSILVLLGLTIAGMVMVLFVHQFRMTASVLFLSLAWCSIVGSGALLWLVGLNVVAGDRGDDGSFDTKTTRRDELEAEKASLLKAIKEIEFDRMMGKLSDEDAKEITELYRRRAITLLKELDTRDDGDGDVDEGDIKSKIERDLRARARLARADRATQARVKARQPKARKSPPPARAEEEE